MFNNTAKPSHLHTYSPFQLTKTFHTPESVQKASIQCWRQKPGVLAPPFCAVKHIQGRTSSPALQRKERDKRSTQDAAIEKPDSFVMIKESIKD